MITQHKRVLIEQEAQHYLENAIDIENDIVFLNKSHEQETVVTFNSALIHSQLFEVPLMQKCHHLFTLSEFSKLPKHTNSFVCFHDEGNTIYHIIKININLPYNYHKLT